MKTSHAPRSRAAGIAWACALLFLAAAPGARGEDCELPAGEKLRRVMNMPREPHAILVEHVPREEVELDVCHLNPYFLRGDFDGDGKPDYLVRLISAEPERPGRLAVIHGKGAVSWLDRSEELQYPGPNVWSVLPGDPIEQSPYEEAPPPSFRGDVIVMQRFEASSAYVYWDGERFRSYWVGD